MISRYREDMNHIFSGFKVVMKVNDEVVIIHEMGNFEISLEREGGTSTTRNLMVEEAIEEVN